MGGELAGPKTDHFRTEIRLCEKQTIFRPKEGDKKKGSYSYYGVGHISARRLEVWGLYMDMC